MNRASKTKKGQEESPNPLNLLAPQTAIPKRTFVGWDETEVRTNRQGTYENDTRRQTATQPTV